MVDGSISRMSPSCSATRVKTSARSMGPWAVWVSAGTVHSSFVCSAGSQMAGNAVILTGSDTPRTNSGLGDRRADGLGDLCLGKVVADGNGIAHGGSR